LPEISVQHLTKYYGDEIILDDISFDIEPGEKVAFLGANGSGKSTLFKILSGKLHYDSGEIIVRSDKRIGMTDQLPEYPAGTTVGEVLDSGFSHIQAIRDELTELEKRMAYDDSAAVMSKYAYLTAKFETEGGYDMNVRRDIVCGGLEISREMQQREYARLSGGEQTRINMAMMILKNTEIILLDEPTNHLDVSAIEFLEDYVSKYKGTVLVVSHDRYFIDRTVTRVIELEDHKLNFYPGNYTFYVEERQRRYEEQLKRYEQEQRKADQLAFTVERMKGWGLGNAKLMRRAFAMEKRLDRMIVTEKPKAPRRGLQMGFSQKEFRGDDVMQLREISKSFGDRKILEPTTLNVLAGERIALIGDNGAGKTTLLRILTGELRPDGGTLRFGPTIKMGYLPQIVEFQHPERSLVDTMIYETDCTPGEARNRLGAFGFRGEDVFKQIQVLSGGERSRLALCMLMGENVNLLILDEPTNHLDIESREWIEAAVEDYTGNLLFVSHDRYFINQFGRRIWDLSDGMITDYYGTYREYRDYRAKQPKETKPAYEVKPEKKTSGGNDLYRREVEAKKLRRTASELEKKIAATEAKIAENTSKMAENPADFVLLGELSAENAEIGEQEEQLYAELSEVWERLDELGNME